VGWGLATATYPAHLMEAKASATLTPEGVVVVRSGTQDIGTGTYTVMTQVAADALGIPIDLVRFELGDTRLPKAPISGGSMTAASVGPAVQAACETLRRTLAAEDGRWLEAADEDGRRAAFRALAARRRSSATAEGSAGPRTKDEQRQEFA